MEYSYENMIRYTIYDGKMYDDVYDVYNGYSDDVYDVLL